MKPDIKVGEVYTRSEIDSMGLRFMFFNRDRSAVFGMEGTMYVLGDYVGRLVVQKIYEGGDKGETQEA